jgi:hypothetical protein
MGARGSALAKPYFMVCGCCVGVFQQNHTCWFVVTTWERSNKTIFVGLWLLCGSALE